MNVLLIGAGGREHALAWKIAQSPSLTRLYIAPGNPGTSLLGENIPVEAISVEMLVDIARREQIDLVVVGPEAALAVGIADACIDAGIPVFGPTRAAAQIETSKVFAKQLMATMGVPTAEAYTFTNPHEAAVFVRARGTAWVVKADGLAGGKGVVVPNDVAGTLAAIEQLAQTSAGQTLLLEQRLHGLEVSVIALCDGQRLLALPPAQDHKRLLDGDRGPNTGGMGAFAPSHHVDRALLDEIVDRAMRPVVDELAARGTPFRGALYAGIILSDEGPFVLEFNARFGDPETQAIMPLIEGDLLAALFACAEGRLEPDMLRWREGAAACVVLAAGGYPEAPRTNDVISGLEGLEEAGTLVFQAGTDWHDGQLWTNGGRVLGITSTGHTLQSAVERAYEAIDQISFQGMQFRRDIGT